MRRSNVGLFQFVFALLLLNLAATGHAQRFGAIGSPPGSVLELVRSEAVVEELELVDHQVQAIRELGEQFRAELRRQLEGLRNFRDLTEREQTERRDALRHAIDQQAREAQRRIDELLLPHQQRRLRQIRLQLRLRGGSTRLFESEEIREALSLSDEQIAQLDVAMNLRQRKLNEEIRQLRQRASQEVLDQVLSEEQREKFREVIGEPFEPPEEFNGARPSVLLRGPALGPPNGGLDNGRPAPGGSQ